MASRYPRSGRRDWTSQEDHCSTERNWRRRGDSTHRASLELNWRQQEDSTHPTTPKRNWRWREESPYRTSLERNGRGQKDSPHRKSRERNGRKHENSPHGTSLESSWRRQGNSTHRKSPELNWRGQENSPHRKSPELNWRRREDSPHETSLVLNWREPEDSPHSTIPKRNWRWREESPHRTSSERNGRGQKYSPHRKSLERNWRRREDSPHGTSLERNWRWQEDSPHRKSSGLNWRGQENSPHRKSAELNWRRLGKSPHRTSPEHSWTWREDPRHQTSSERNWGGREDLPPSETNALSSSSESSADEISFFGGVGVIDKTPIHPVPGIEPDRSESCNLLLKELQMANVCKVVSPLHGAKNYLAMFFDEPIAENKLQIVVHLLSNVFDSDQIFLQTNDIVTLLHEKRFLELYITPWISRWKTYYPPKEMLERNLEAIISILVKMLHEVPDSMSAIGATLLVLRTIAREREVNNNEIFSNVSGKLQHLVAEHERFQRESHEMTSRGSGKSRPNQQPPDNFRYLPIAPMPHELRSNHKPFLRANIVNGSYESVHHYLDVHFRLLREDFMRPLREGISEYTASSSSHKFQQKPVLQNAVLYLKVRVRFLVQRTEGSIYSLTLNKDRSFSKIDWESSKRLLPGSLVCLSSDHFNTLIFCTVSKREAYRLADGLIEVMISGNRLLGDGVYDMIEPQSYFESYKHVLSCLQNINEDTFPFQQCIVFGSTKTHLPKYVTVDPPMTFRIYGDYKEVTSDHKVINCRRVTLEDDSSWPTGRQLGLDSSQMEAFKAGLTEDVCVIQGPPGTGKTFLGLKIVETLLLNKTRWSTNKPLLVVCYTNHALDQFLEGILKFEDRVIRLGKRTSSEKVQRRNIELVLGTEMFSKVKSVNLRRNRVNLPNLDKCKDIPNMARRKLLSISSLKPIMSAAHHHSLKLSSFYQNENCILDWLFSFEIKELSAEQKEKAIPEGFKSVHGAQNKGADEEGNEVEEDIGEGTDNEDEEEDEEEINDDDEGLKRAVFDSIFQQSKGENQFKQNEGSKTNYVFITESELKEYKDHLNVTRQETLCQLIEKKLLQDDAMTKEEAEMVTDVWSLDLDQRWRLYRLWQRLFIREKEEELERSLEQLTGREVIERQIKEIEIRRAFQGFSVIGATTTGAAKNSPLLQILGPPIVIVEEAAEILEAHVVTALSSNCKHLILIGDHQQLRPSPEVYELCMKYKLDVSLFERLVKNGIPCHRLSTQHRMRPEISHLLKIHKDFYPGLTDHDIVTEYENIRGLDKNLYFVDHCLSEDHNNDNRSRSNHHEATFLHALYLYLLQQGYSSSQITILTAYRGQVRSFKELMDKTHFRETRVCPIDNFQGEENDIILFSFVRSNDEGNIGFLKISNRICVALSRAKKGLYCIGNFTLMSQQNAVWKTIIDNLHTRKCFGPYLKLVCRNHPNTFTEVAEARDFHKAPDGGCSEPCNARLNCGHTCQKACHPEDREHRKIICEKPCENVMCELQHVCPLLCGDDCGDKCTKIIEHALPCSHKQHAMCYLRPDEVFLRSKL